MHQRVPLQITEDNHNAHTGMDRKRESDQSPPAGALPGSGGEV